jgi:hypothetical protein
VVLVDDAYTEYWADSWSILVQDGGKTVKLFARGDGAEPVSARNAALGKVLGVSSDTAAAFTQAVAESEGQPEQAYPEARTLRDRVPYPLRIHRVAAVRCASALAAAGHEVRIAVED